MAFSNKTLFTKTEITLDLMHGLQFPIPQLEHCISWPRFGSQKGTLYHQIQQDSILGLCAFVEKRKELFSAETVTKTKEAWICYQPHLATMKGSLPRSEDT